MAFITSEITCNSIQRTVPVRLYFPTDLPEEVGNKVNGVITLLHGMGNTSGNWFMYSAACRYAADNGFILVAPDAENSIYTDMKNGAAYYTLLTEDLPEQLRAIFHIPDEREKNFIAGLSMGGYGALRIGLLRPEKYAAVGSFSGALDMPGMAQATKGWPVFGPMFTAAFGEALNVPDDADVFKLAKSVAGLPIEKKPRIFQTCGLQDTGMGLLEKNRELHTVLETAGFDTEYREWNGVHEWNFWDRSLAEFIGWARGTDYGERKRADWA